MLPDDPDSKVNAADNVYRIWENHADTKAAQLVFCDLSTPKMTVLSMSRTICAEAIERGIPAEQVRFIHEATTDAQKKELFGKVRSGEVRILFGSTPKMGAGTNVQDRLVQFIIWIVRGVQVTLNKGRDELKGKEICSQRWRFIVMLQSRPLMLTSISW
jgi:hypothetical protein